MAPSRHSIQQSIRDITNGNRNIPMIDLVMTLVNIYGVEDEARESGYNYIQCINSSRYISDTYLDELMDILLGEGKDISMAINTNPEFSGRFTFYYDTEQGEGIIGLRE